MSIDAKTLGNEPASYVPDVIDHERSFYSYGGPGLTKREAFAMAAMQGLIANTQDYDMDQLKALAGVDGEWVWPTHWPLAVAAMAASHADALLAELAKESA